MTQPTVHHVGITVADRERCVEFYRDVLGFDVLDRFAVSGEAFARGVDVAGATGRFAHLDGGDVRLELVEYDPEGAACGGSRVNQPGAKHVGCAVSDLDDFVASLPDSVERLSDPQTTESGTRIVFLRDPEGNLVEVLET